MSRFKDRFGATDCTGTGDVSLVHIGSTVLNGVDSWIPNPVEEGSPAEVAFDVTTLLPNIGDTDDI